MKVFRMNGFPITRASDYMKHFSPADFVRNRELAAGFVCQQMWQLKGPWNYYCCKVMEQVTFNWQNVGKEELTSAEGFFSLCGALQMRLTSEYYAALQEGKTPANRKLLERLWTLSRETALPDSDAKRLFCLLGAGYLLAGETLDEMPLYASQARAAFQRISESEEKKSDEWVAFPESGEIRLKARLQPYRILMSPGAARTKLAAGGRIHVCRLLALPHEQGNRSLPVTLALYRNFQDSHPTKVEIMPGDFRYISCVNRIPYHIHPNTVQCGDSVMTRTAGELTLTSGGTSRLISTNAADVISFSPESNGEGYILITRGGADFSHYSLREVFSSFTLIREDIVEVRIRPDICLILRADGCVFSNISRGKSVREGVLSLEEEQ